MTKRPSLFAFLLAATFAVSACSGGGSSPTVAPSSVGIAPTSAPTPTPAPTSTGVFGGGGGASPTPVPTSTGFNTSAFTCPSSDGTSAVAVGGGSSFLTEGSRHAEKRGAIVSAPKSGLLAVTYDLGTLNAQRSTIAAREVALGASAQRELQFTHLGTAVRVVAVNPANAARIEAQLRMVAGVKSVGTTGERRYGFTVSQPYFTTDPYFDGFQNTVPPTSGATAPPSTYHVGPYEESASVPGQWDKHAIKSDYAFEYSQPNNGSGITNGNALGSASIKIAVIDTGADTLHPKLQSKVGYQKCFITNPNNQQSTSNYSTDPQGHGTDVSGIAAETINSGLGFSPSGGQSTLYSYRVFPTPDDNCVNENTTDDQCGADTADIAAAIDDAVNQGVNVISLSLGGGTCTNGQDSDPTEGQAIANAINANVVVVAAAGNGGTQGVSSPGCDTGVIAAGASALADGQPNGTNSAGSASAPVEYVASYSQYGSPAAAAKSASAWGIVAPGGDPSGDNDEDDLHWIENIWTSTPYMSSPNDNDYEGECAGDYPNETGTTDCRVLIAGTSMSTPQVAGAAALILAVNSSYQSPTKMKQLLCTTADDIGDPHEGCGRLNVYRAMATALGDPNLP